MERHIPIGSELVLKENYVPAKRNNVIKQSLRVFMQDKLAVIGAVIVFFVLTVSILAPVIAPYDPNIGEGSKRLLPIGTPGHILGLDEQGRDILSRLIWGGRLSLISGIVPIVLMFTISLTVGLIAGYFSRVGEVIMRILDILFAFPTVLLAIAIAAIIGSGLTTILLSMCIVMLPYMTRVVFTSTMNEKNKEYVEAAKALGANKFEILFKEIMPNVMTDLIVYSTTLIGVMIVFAAGLSFIGLGIQPPEADWGRMVAGGTSVLTQGAPHISTIPGIVILIVATAFNWLGDGLQSALDPYKRTQ